MDRCREYDLSSLPEAELYDAVFLGFEDFGDPQVRDAWQHCMRAWLLALLEVPPEDTDRAASEPGGILAAGIPPEHVSYWNLQFARNGCFVKFVPSALREPSPYSSRVEAQRGTLSRFPKCPRCASVLMDVTEGTRLGKPLRKACCALCGLRWRLK